MDENNGNTVTTINQREASFIAHTRALARQISYFTWEHCGMTATDSLTINPVLRNKITPY